MTDFDSAFQVFTNAMRLKFHERHEKQHRMGYKSVLDQGFSELDLHPGHIDAHLREEIAELLGADAAHRSKEAIDVANMAFLTWWKWLEGQE